MWRRLRFVSPLCLHPFIIFKHLKMFFLSSLLLPGNCCWVNSKSPDPAGGSLALCFPCTCSAGEAWTWALRHLHLFVSAGLTTEGLYRVSGNKTDQDNIQKLFDQGESLPARRGASARAPRLRQAPPSTRLSCVGPERVFCLQITALTLW